MHLQEETDPLYLPQDEWMSRQREKYHRPRAAEQAPPKVASEDPAATQWRSVSPQRRQLQVQQQKAAEARLRRLMEQLEERKSFQAEVAAEEKAKMVEQQIRSLDAMTDQDLQELQEMKHPRKGRGKKTWITGGTIAPRSGLQSQTESTRRKS